MSKESVRKSKRKSAAVNGSSKAMKIEEKPRQWVFILPDKIIRCDANNDSSPSFVKIRHPKTRDGNLYLLSADKATIYEIKRFSEDNRSWFINDTVQEDGSINICTPIHPLYLILPYLYDNTNFIPLSQALVDDEFPGISDILECANEEVLQNIADVKGDPDLKVLRYNKDKSLKWLQEKVENLSKALKDKDIHVSGGSQVATFVRSNKDSIASNKDYTTYALGMIGDYISEEVCSDLKQLLGIKDPVKEQPKEEEFKKRKRDEPVQPVDDYRKQNGSSKTPDVKPAKGPKLTLAQKALSKVDKTGMKSITSFFTKKT